MKLIIGLGNPGETYRLTRHNIGFMLIDKLIRQLNATPLPPKHHSQLAKVSWNEEILLLSQPLTYMNLSGQAVLAMKKFYRTELDNFLIIADDCDLNFGTTKIRSAGGSGGHNGLKSIINSVGTNFSRLRVGIGRPQSTTSPNSQPSLDQHVLGKFSPQEQKQLPQYLDFVTEIVLHFLKYGVESTMNQFNKRPYEKKQP